MSSPASGKIELIAREIRSRIVCKGYPPGGRLPTRTELESEFTASSATVQRSLDALTEDGFIVPRGCSGTFVASAPPCFSRYALIFPGVPEPGAHWSNFWTALANSGTTIGKRCSRELVALHGFEGCGGYERAARVEREVANHMFAGLIFASPPFYLEGTSIASVKGVPRVAVASHAYKAEETWSIGFDSDSFYRKALEHLRKLGSRRVAVIVQAELDKNSLEHILSLIAEMGFESKPQWVQAVSVKIPFWTKQVVDLLFDDVTSDEKKKRSPDSLLIADDNFVDHATAALAAKGLDGRIPVVAGANFPWVTPSHTAVTRLGFDIDSLMVKAVGIIDAWHEGKAPTSRFEELPALFESEWRKDGKGR